MSDDVFWNSSIAFLFQQFDLMKEMNEKAKKGMNKRKTGIEKTERVEKQSLRVLSPKEIAELRSKNK